jgi:hypothetical protein
VVDGNFAKLAAKGISIMISSGDSGSGYAAPERCMAPGAKGVGISGTVATSTVTHGYGECCETASGSPAGWSFAEWPKQAVTATTATAETPAVDAAEGAVVHAAASGDLNFKQSLFHVQFANPKQSVAVFWHHTKPSNHSA